MARAADRPYRVFRKHHRNLHRTLWDQIEKRDPKLCWRWMGDHNADGVAKYTFGHQDGFFTIAVDRYLFYAVYDRLPRVVDHTCGNPWCCNVNHLVAASAHVLHA
jgi:hypothetical protein